MISGYQTRPVLNPVPYGSARYRPSLAEYNRTDPRLQGPSFIPASPLSGGLVNSPMTEDQFALLINSENARKSRDLRTRAENARAQDEGNFLDSISAADYGGIFEPAEDERSARLQSLLNRDYRARDRGSRLSMAGRAWNDEIARKMAPYNLDVAQFREGARDRQQRRALQELQIEGLQDYRDRTLEQRGQAQQGLQDYRGQSLAQRDESNAARVTNQNANRELRERQFTATNQRAQSNQTRSRFLDAINAARRGASLEQLDAAFTSLFPDLTPDQQQVAMATMAQRAQESSGVGTSADRYNQALAFQLRQTIDSGGNLDDAIASTITEANRDPNARGRIIYDPAQRRFVPLPRYAPQDIPMLSPGRGGMSSPSMIDIAEEPAGAAAPLRSGPPSVIPVPAGEQGRFQNGRAYIFNGVGYRYVNGQMVRQ